MNRQQIQERIEKCHEILGANPNSQIFAALAEAYRKIGELSAALEVCNKGLLLHPAYGSAHLVMAKVARDQHRFKQAEQSAYKAIELDGRTRSAEILLSDIYLQTGKFDKAEELLQDLEIADPKNESVVKLKDLVQKARQLAEMKGSGNVLVPGSVTGAFLTTTHHPKFMQAGSPFNPAEATPNAPADSNIADAEAETDPPGEELTWESIFAGLDRYPNLKGKMAAGYDGMLLKSDLEVQSEAEAVAAMAADLFAGIRTDWLGDRFGLMKQLFIETDDSSWLIWPFNDFLLLLWCDPGINMGPLRMRLQHLDGSGGVQTYGGNK